MMRLAWARRSTLWLGPSTERVARLRAQRPSFQARFAESMMETLRPKAPMTEMTCLKDFGHIGVANEVGGQDLRSIAYQMGSIVFGGERPRDSFAG